MVASLMNFAGIVAHAVFSLMFVIGLCWIVERRHPIEPDQSRSEILLDYTLVLATVVLKRAFAPVVGLFGAMWVNAAGGGFITLRADGLWFPVSLVLIIFIFEFEGYWLHRLQHSVPFLWSMHSLHHSAQSMTAATGARHYWVEGAIIAALLPSLAMIFRIPHEVLKILPYFFMTEQLAHMNAKVQLGPLTLVFNNPQFHRIHHSVELEHCDKNFCKNLPILDIIFGTAWMPGKDEFPRTGLSTNEKPASLVEGLVWPVRNVPVIRRLLGPVSQNQRALGTPLSSELG
jgi:sterol desaturase/sphingolipid hydroxylase (fatty acid hydroxylase superfamily)